MDDKARPRPRGFGSTPVEHAAARELGARPEPTFVPAGSGAEIAGPLGRVPFSNPR
jgi:hypothetical protein